jgi:multicomponent Na+:H+ antiporter subunit D
MSVLLGHPALAYLAGVLLVLALPRRLLPLALAAPVAALLLVERLAGLDPSVVVPFAGVSLQPLRADALGLLFARIFALAGGLALLYGLREPSRAALAAGMATVAAALGVVLAGDLVTLFVFWELKALATTVIIVCGGMPGSVRAGQRYLLAHTAGGTVLLVGIALHAAKHGVAFDAMALDGATAWILAGFALSAAIPPLHAWLTEAYPEGSPFGTVLLSAFTTKAAVYALCRGFPGVELLVWVGAGMAIYGAAFAVLENDIRRLLAYHIVSQVGFMVCGVGMGALTGDPQADKIASLALNGTTAHAVSHILYKGLLLMSAGAVVYATGKRKLTELGGLWRHMPLTLLLCMIGAFSISGVPLWNGFVSKSMVISAAGYGDRVAIEWMLTGASIGTFLHTGLKLPWFVFFGEDRGVRPARPVPWNMTAAMILAAILCTVTGVVPDLLYRFLPFAATYEPFTLAHVLESTQLLLATALAFFLLLPMLGGEPVVLRDAGLLYRLAGRAVVAFAREVVVPLHDAGGTAAARVARALPDAGRRVAGMARAPVGFWVMVAVGTLAALVFVLRGGLLE